MGRFSIWDPRYNGLDTQEKARQVERDNLLYEQTEALIQQTKMMSERQQEVNYCNVYSDDTELDNKIAKELANAYTAERQENAYIESLWVEYNDLKDDIDVLNTRLKTYLYGTESYKELYNFIKEKENELKDLKRKTQLKVTRYYDSKLNAQRKLNDEKIRKEKILSKEYELKNLFTSHAVWLFDIVFLGSIIGLPIAYFIDTHNGTNILPIVLYSLIGYALLNIFIYFVRKSFLRMRWNSKIKRI